MPKQPTEEGKPISPQIRRDLTGISNQDLGKELSKFTACTDYATFQATIADLEATIAEQVLDMVTSQVRQEKTGTVQERSDKTRNDPRVKALHLEYFQKHAVARLTEAIVRNFERDVSAISREITRRGNEFMQRQG